MPDDPKKPNRNKPIWSFDFNKNRVWSEGLAFVMQIGLTMVGSIFFGFFVGLYLDKWLGTRGIFLILFILFGVVGGAYTAYRQIQETIEKDEKRQQQDEAEKDDGND